MKGISRKLHAGMIALTLTLLLLVWFFQLIFLDKFCVQHQVHNIKNEAMDIVREMNGAGRGMLEDRLDRIGYNNKANISLVDTKGDILYSNEQIYIMEKDSFNENTFEEVMKGNVTTTFAVNSRFGDKFANIGIPVTSEGITAAGLFISMPLAPIKDTANILKKQIVHIIILLIIPALILSNIIVRILTRGM